MTEVQRRARIALTIGKATSARALAARANYVAALERARAEVVVVEPGQPIPADVDGLCLSGGPDIAPARYGEPDPKHLATDPDLERDELEFGAIAAALRRDLPVLGTSRGSQPVHVALGGTVPLSTGTGAPVDQTRVALGQPLRIALLHGRGDGSRRTVAHVALASAAEIVASVRASDSRHFVAAAQALREARPEVVVVHADAKDEAPLAELLEALRLGCAAQQPAPRILALVETRLGEALRRRAYPFEFERFADAPALVGTLRALRRAGSDDVVLRDALIEDGARSLAATTATSARAVAVP